ncbi:MAG TPA: Holliday junction resolvase RuvX [Chloroflexota bacterium]
MWYHGPVRYLSVDVGEKWVGLALSDPTGFLATPLNVISRGEAHGARIRALIEEYEVEAVVFGLPLNMDGSSGSQVEATYAYVQGLGPLPVPISYWDERLSSWEAEQMMSQVRGRVRRRRERLDAIAAALMLQDFLDTRQQESKRAARAAN